MAQHSHVDSNLLCGRCSGHTWHQQQQFGRRVLLPENEAGGWLQGINGNKMEKACDLVHITLNKNAVVGDVSALAPGGVRIGAPAMTSRGLQEADFEKIADLLHEVRCAAPCRRCCAKTARKTLHMDAFCPRKFGSLSHLHQWRVLGWGISAAI